MDMPNLIHWAIPIFVVTVILENYWTWKKSPDTFVRVDSLASIAMGLGNVFIGLLTNGIIFALTLWVYEYRIWTIDMSVLAYIGLFFLEDLAYYAHHRMSHQVRFFWASHVIHHSSRAYNLSTALRQTWTGFTSFSFMWLPLALLGFHPVWIAFQKGVSLLYQYWIHTEHIGTLGWLEWVFNTPSHHRVHHGSDVKYLDRNHAGILIIWDRLFGTFQPEEERPNYGLTKNIESYNPLRIATHEWVQMVNDAWHAPDLISAWKYLFYPPGWSPDGSTKTARELKVEAGLLETRPNVASDMVHRA